MREKERIELSGETFEVTQFGAKKADKLLAWLFRKLAKPIRALEGADNLESKIYEAGAGLIESLEPDDLEWLRDQLLVSVAWIRKGERGIEVAVPLEPEYDKLFRGKGPDRMRLLTFALKVNFADFLGESGVKSFFADVVQKAQSHSNSQKNAIGSSGGSIGTTSGQS